MKPIYFTNYTEQDFVGMYNKKDRVIKSGETLLLPAELAKHYAKHLVDRELHKKGLQVSDPLKHELLKKISSELRWDDKKHFVLSSDDEAGMIKTSSIEDQVEALNMPKPEGVSDPAREVQEKPMMLWKREELEKKAMGMGFSQDEVMGAKSKNVLIEMMGKKDEVLEDSFAGK